MNIDSGPLAPRWRAIDHISTTTSGHPSAETLAARLLDSAGVVQAPVDLLTLTRRWPGLRTIIEPLDGPGYLLDLGLLGGEILVRQQDDRARQRFTLAHELGHWLLGPPAADAILTRGGSSHPDKSPDVARERVNVAIERWCDTFATELLMPGAWLSQRRTDPLEELATFMLEMPGQYEVSRQAAWIRAAELFGVGIAYWKAGSAPRYVEPKSFNERERIAFRSLTEIYPPGSLKQGEMVHDESFSSLEMARVKVAGTSDVLTLARRIETTSA